MWIKMTVSHFSHLVLTYLPISYKELIFFFKSNTDACLRMTSSRSLMKFYTAYYDKNSFLFRIGVDIMKWILLPKNYPVTVMPSIKLPWPLLAPTPISWQKNMKHSTMKHGQSLIFNDYQLTFIRVKDP